MQFLCQDYPFPRRKPNTRPNLHGWLGDGNQLLLKKFIRKDTKLIFEFGTWLGKSAMFMLNQQADNPEFQKVVCVDTWEGDWSIKQTNKYKQHLANLYDTFIVNMWEVRDRVVPVRMDGRKAMKYLHGLGLKPDLIYLDMDHSYESAKGDLECLMKYFPDTLILGDDILYWKGVAKAVKEIVKAHNITNLEINKNCYALVPRQYCKRYRLKELITKVIQPKEQYIDYKIAIIVGFHPRFHTHRQLHRFREHMVSFMENSGVDYKIYVIEQHDQQQELNLGHLYNSGYEIALADGCEKFVFQDIYLLPSKALVPYYRRHNKYPIHLGYHYDKYFYEVYYLGIIMFNKENFEMVNGYPINIYGLYGWDYEMVLRIKDVGLKLKLPAEGTMIPNGTHPRINVQEWRKIKTSVIINKHSETWKSNGLKNTFYVRKNRHNSVHTMKKNAQCGVYSVSFVDYTYYIMFPEDVVWEMDEEVKEEPELCLEMKDTPEEATFTFKQRIRWRNMLSNNESAYDISSNILHVYEKRSDSPHYFRRSWKNARKEVRCATAKNKNGKQTNYDLEALCQYIKNDNIIKQGTIRAMLCYPQTTQYTNLKRMNSNGIEAWIHQINKSNASIQFKHITYSLFSSCKSHDSNSATDTDEITNQMESYADYLKIDTFIKQKLDLIFFPTKKKDNSRFAYNNSLFFQMIIAFNFLQMGGSCVFGSVSFPQMCQPSFYYLLRLLKFHFKNIKLVRSKYNALKARKVHIVCNDLRHHPNTKKYNSFFAREYTEENMNTFLHCFEYNTIVNTSFIQFVNDLCVKQLSVLEKLNEFENSPIKAQNEIIKKHQHYKSNRLRQMI